MEPKHTNLQLANTEINWIDTDSEELYKTNLEQNYQLLKEFDWVDKMFTYKFNNYGFRGDDLNSEPGVMFLGCSHTFGVGLPIETTWSHLISSAMGLKNYNLGVGGSSNDTAFRLAQYWIPKIKPKVVVFASTERTRFELHTLDNEMQNLNVWKDSKDLYNFWRHWIGNDTNSNMNYLKNQLAIKQLCQENNIKYFHIEILKDTIEIDKARDLMHYGIKTHKRIANGILRMLGRIST